MDVVVWLRSLGLGKYEAIFRENDIDETVLASLTQEHLKKQLGVGIGASDGSRLSLARGHEKYARGLCSSGELCRIGTFHGL
jgi:hypothetical protein